MPEAMFQEDSIRLIDLQYAPPRLASFIPEYSGKIKENLEVAWHQCQFGGDYQHDLMISVCTVVYAASYFLVPLVSKDIIIKHKNQFFHIDRRGDRYVPEMHHLAIMHRNKEACQDCAQRLALTY